MNPSAGDGLPSANNPTLLLRFMELVCAGVRGQRSLEEVLAVDARTIRYYRQAAAWLALIDDE